MLWPGRTAESPRAAAAGPVVPGSAGSAPCCTVRSCSGGSGSWLGASRRGTDRSDSSLFMQVPSSSVPVAMVGAETAHIADRCFEIRHETLLAIERDHLQAVLRVFGLDHAQLARRDAVIAHRGLFARRVDLWLRDFERIKWNMLHLKVSKLMISGQSLLGQVAQITPILFARLNGNTFTTVSLPSAAARRCADHASSAARFSRGHQAPKKPEPAPFESRPSTVMTLSPAAG